MEIVAPQTCSTLYVNLEDWPANILEVPPPALIRGRIEAFQLDQAQIVLQKDERSPAIMMNYRMADSQDGGPYPARQAVHFGKLDPAGLDHYERDARALLRCVLLEWLCRALNRGDGGSPRLGEVVRLADPVRRMWGELGEAHSEGLTVLGRCQWLEPMRRIVDASEEAKMLPRTIQRALCVRSQQSTSKGSLWVPLGAIELLH